MPRYILIDSYSGYIFGDTADYLNGHDFISIVEAAQLLDASIGKYGLRYEELDRNPGTGQTGYDVYRADIGGSDVVPIVHDGQNQETIETVERDCEYVGFVLTGDGKCN